MAFNLDGLNRNDEWVGYFPQTTGIDREGNECVLILSHNPNASGCNPFYWEPQHNGRAGYEFLHQAIAEEQSKYAAKSYLVKSVNEDQIKIGAVKFKVVKTAVNMGVVA